MKFTPASVALSKTRKDSASSVCLPNVPVPRQRRETVRPVRPNFMNCMRTPSRETSWSQRADNEKVWRLNLEPERRSVTLHMSSGRRGIVGADDQDRLVGPLGEQL